MRVATKYAISRCEIPCVIRKWDETIRMISVQRDIDGGRYVNTNVPQTSQFDQVITDLFSQISSRLFTNLSIVKLTGAENNLIYPACATFK